MYDMKSIDFAIFLPVVKTIDFVMGLLFSDW